MTSVPRKEAVEVVGRIAESLQNWHGVATDGSEWEPLSLANGFPGVSLLFSELSARDTSFLPTLHTYLNESQKHVAKYSERSRGIYRGIPAFGFGLLCAHRATGGYRKALEKMDEAIRRIAAVGLSEAERRGPSTFHLYDVVSGLSGLARYLLERPSRDNVDVLNRILSYLVSLCEEYRVGDVEVPRWWASHSPDEYIEHGDPTGGHGNLGLAHGVAGPLALMSFASMKGHEVPGQPDALNSLGEVLLEWQAEDEYGAFWPRFISYEQYLEKDKENFRRGRPSWCYGAPGVSCALNAAGIALGNADFVSAAAASIQSLISVPEEEWRVADASMCHGWAGLLHILRMFQSEGDVSLARLIERLALKIIGEFDHDYPFKYQFAAVDPAVDLNSPGFLDGSAGVALALHSYAHDEPVSSGWDSALLIS